MTQHDERLKVLLLSNSVSLGGMEEHVRLLAKYLDRDEFEVFAVCPDWPDTADFATSLRDAADHLALISPDRRYGLFLQLRDSIKLIRQVRLWKIDVAHLHSTTFRGQMVAACCIRLGGAKHIYLTEHLAPDIQIPLARRIWRHAFGTLISGIVCVSQKNYEARAARLLTPAGKTMIIPNGVEISRFEVISDERLHELRAELDIAQHAPIVGTVVRFEPEKGLDDLVKAFAIVHEQHPEAVLLLVGDGSLRSDLENEAAELGLTKSVRFPGFRNDPRDFLGLMDVFVLPVPVGSMSIGLLEAMAMRRPPVITFGGDGEAVVHGRSGFNADPHNPRSIASYVMTLLDQPALRREIGDAAHDRVEAHFSARQVAVTLGRLYRFGLSGVEHPRPYEGVSESA